MAVSTIARTPREISFTGATNSSSVTVSAGSYADVPLNWSRTDKTWLFCGNAYAGSTGLVVVNLWFNNDKLTATIRNVVNQSITVAANKFSVIVGYR